MTNPQKIQGSTPQRHGFISDETSRSLFVLSETCETFLQENKGDLNSVSKTKTRICSRCQDMKYFSQYWWQPSSTHGEDRIQPPSHQMQDSSKKLKGQGQASGGRRKVRVYDPTVRKKVSEKNGFMAKLNPKAHLDPP